MKFRLNMSAHSRRSATTTDIARAALFGAAIVALVNATAIQVRPSSDSRTTTLLHQLFDAGQLLALALLISGSVALWMRFAKPLRRYDSLMMAALSFSVGALVLPASFRGYVEKLTDNVPAMQLALWGMVLLTSLSLPVALWLGSRLARPGWRWLALAFGVGLATLNNAVLDHDYHGIHLFLTLQSLIFCSAASHNIESAVLAHRPRLVRGMFVLAISLAFASVSLPSNAMRVRLASVEGAPLARAVNSLYQRLSPKIDVEQALADLPEAQRRWFLLDERAPAIPASSPTLLPADPIVIMLTLDCARGDILTNKRFKKTFDYLREFTKSAVVFRNAYSTGAATVPSLTTIFSGKHYSQLIWQPRRESLVDVWPMADESPRFPELLQRAQVTTVNIASKNWLINRDRVVAGFTRETNLAKGRKVRAPHIRSNTVFPAMQRALAKVPSGPTFLFAHLMDPHSPYNSGKLKKGRAIDRYASEIDAVATRLKRFEKWLDKKGLLSRTTFIITADHGEAFGEHQTWDHSKTVYQELIHVPLWIRVPGVQPREVEQPVSLIDLGPTLLDLMGQPTPGHYMGQSLVPFLRGESPVLTRPIVAEARLIQTLIFPDGMKVIRDLQQGTFELYDLHKDPKEQNNLATGPEGKHQRWLEAFFVHHTHPSYDEHAPYRN